ncbi:MAG: hypothetical protein AAFY03_09555 [Pseudomonadota bacterium]
MAPALSDIATRLSPDAKGSPVLKSGFLHAAHVTHLMFLDLVSPQAQDGLAADKRSILPLGDNALVPLDGNDLARLLPNARTGRLSLDTIYGSNPKAIRNPDNPRHLSLTAPLPDRRLEYAPQVGWLARLLQKYHNFLADTELDAVSKPDPAFSRARRQTTWTWQWLLLNDALPMICDPDVLAWVIAERAPLYRAFYRRTGGRGKGLPVPCEFAFALSGFGIAPFGDAAAGTILDSAGTASAHADLRSDHWPDNLIARILRTGYRLSLPTAQGVLEALVQLDRSVKEAPTCIILTTDDLRGGTAGDLLEAHGFLERTPLLYYFVREAEVVENGARLGPLGSRIMAETVVGLLASDLDSHLNVDGPKWEPPKGCRSFAELAAAHP